MHVQDHRQPKELLLRQPHVLDNRLVGGLVHEALQRAEGSADKAEDIASLALVQLHGLHCAGGQSLGLRWVLHEQVDEGTSVRCAGRGCSGVNAAFRLGLADEASRALTLVRLHRHGRVHIAERLEDVGRTRRCRGALDLLVGAPPEWLAQVNLLPGQIREVALRGFDRRIASVREVVAAVDWHSVGVDVVDDVLPREGCHRVEGSLAILPNIEADALGCLVHASASDEDVLLTLGQCSLERLHLTHEVKVCRIEFLAVAVLGHELIDVRDAVRGLPEGLLGVLVLNLLCADKRRRKEVHGVDGDQVHAGENLWEVLLHKSHEHVVCRQPRRSKDSLLPILRQVLLDISAEGIHLALQGREVAN
mmetsp:Transcript_7996/g.14896  ORF Transcript_7996/g.14896 Transcript_7996/m.14896 type:complete len:364 (-) Transcript_7996:138-1229(-)